MSPKLKIGIILSTTRPGRFGDTPAQWLLDIARKRQDADFELVDLRDYPMPFFEEKVPLIYAPVENAVAKRWAAKMATLDGYVFVAAEYNHSITGVLKNALDHLYSEVQRKPAAFVGYGGVGGARAVEHLRNILAEMHVASLKHAVHVGMIEMIEMIGMLREGKKMTDYPHLRDAAKPMLDDLVWWASSLKAGRLATV
ncbi:MAG: NAD(P)H-dependent oxidoreductase [Hyphomonadaceae bacterium]|jgi:NAD(P)H-dependent FMN reductase|nr:NAD(P)H-dependent oxidoreductase [Hyphomonadaceae bacterium]